MSNALTVCLCFSGMGTGTVMFNNHDPADLKILFGESPFEFRIETSALPESKSNALLKGAWRKFLVQHGFLTK